MLQYVLKNNFTGKVKILAEKEHKHTVVWAVKVA